MKKFFIFMMMAMTLVFIPSCENEEELSNQGEQPVSGLATATGEYVGTIERAASQGLSTVNDNAIIEVQAFDDNTIDITFPKVKSGLLSIEDLVFTEVPVEEVENSADVWNFEEDEEVIVNGSVVRAKVSGKLTPKINQISVNIAISGDGGTLIFKGTKQS
ncbi:MAG: hypothetical protein U0L67_08095 [Paludibacteraceae bacterium]|nr:hypothetical protein [Paludibacteraceae bacterium]